MDLTNIPLREDEKAIFSLRSLYRKYGYSQYKMSKFEEYELYVRNKDFLISDSVITFTDAGGKLMALKPDVTLSIIKNTKDVPGCVNKVYYHENVYRADGSMHSFKEIMQVGLECIGDIDEYSICEVISLAAQSLIGISEDCALVLSSLSILSDVIDRMGVSDKYRQTILRLVGEKNLHELSAICEESGADAEYAAILRKLVATYGTPAEVLPKLESLLRGKIADESLDSLNSLIDALSLNEWSSIIRLDFSEVNNIKYYNGIVFKGFINGIPTGVISGGQYDKLMHRMGRSSRAIGFAVYLGNLERLEGSAPHGYDIDAVLLYGANDAPADIAAAVRKIADGGLTVTAQRSIPKEIKYKKLFRLNGKEVETVEADA